jgi:Mg2+ and Co2+ transporter CorA
MAYLLRAVLPGDVEKNVGMRNAPHVRVIDYSIGRVVHRNPTPLDFTDFLYGPRPDWASNRWIDVSAPCPLVIKGLAIKYRLHPLSLEDALHNEFEQGAKIDRYPNHSFIVFPGMFIDSDPPVMIDESVHAVSGARYYGGARIRHARYPRLRRLNPSKRLLTPLLDEPYDVFAPEDPAVKVLASFPGVVHYNVCIFLSRVRGGGSRRGRGIRERA